jgi:hypothetical protein
LKKLLPTPDPLTAAPMYVGLELGKIVAELVVVVPATPFK